MYVHKLILNHRQLRKEFDKAAPYDMMEHPVNQDEMVWYGMVFITLAHTVSFSSGHSQDDSQKGSWLL